MADKKETKKPKVLIGLPTMGSVHTMLTIQLTRWAIESFQSNLYSLGVWPTIGVQPVDNARNSIVQTMLESDYTHLLWIDSDTLPPPDTILKMLSHDTDIVSGLTPIIDYSEETQDWYTKPNCVDMNDHKIKPNTGVHKIKGAGGSCIMVKREVYEKLGNTPYRFIYKDDSGKDTVVSEDIGFIIKAIGAGFEPICDSSIVCQHHKPILWNL